MVPVGKGLEKLLEGSNGVKRRQAFTDYAGIFLA